MDPLIVFNITCGVLLVLVFALIGRFFYRQEQNINHLYRVVMGYSKPDDRFMRLLNKRYYYKRFLEFGRRRAMRESIHKELNPHLYMKQERYVDVFGIEDHLSDETWSKTTDIPMMGSITNKQQRWNQTGGPVKEVGGMIR